MRDSHLRNSLKRGSARAALSWKWTQPRHREGDLVYSDYHLRLEHDSVFRKRTATGEDMELRFKAYSSVPPNTPVAILGIEALSYRVMTITEEGEVVLGHIERRELEHGPDRALTVREWVRNNLHDRT